MKSKITIWYRLSAKGDRYKFNHISGGWVDELAEPVPISEYQKDRWQNEFWRNELGYLIDSVVTARDNPPESTDISGDIERA